MDCGGAGLVLFFGALGYELSKESAPKPESAQRAPMAAAPAAQESPRMQAALETLNQNPDDLPSLTLLGHELIKRQSMEQAIRIVDRASALDPFQVETRVHRALLQAVQGGSLVDTQATLDHLAKTYPGAYEALLYGGILSLQQGDKRGALNRFEAYVAEAPVADQAPMIRTRNRGAAAGALEVTRVAQTDHLLGWRDRECMSESAVTKTIVRELFRHQPAANVSEVNGSTGRTSPFQSPRVRPASCPVFAIRIEWSDGEPDSKSDGQRANRGVGARPARHWIGRDRHHRPRAART